NFGRDLLLLTDINADGYIDLVIGEFTFNNNLGRVLVYF
ncbi:MAG: FG-GAP repeat protein, partial [Deltaproteobacteria bacterium]|nr:FG-GAP repeat protein [Deltaproteobacteria bacterium]